MEIGDQQRLEVGNVKRAGEIGALEIGHEFLQLLRIDDACIAGAKFSLKLQSIFDLAHVFFRLADAQIADP